jgi:hypothetical protein
VTGLENNRINRKLAQLTVKLETSNLLLKHLKGQKPRQTKRIKGIEKQIQANTKQYLFYYRKFNKILRWIHRVGTRLKIRAEYESYNDQSLLKTRTNLKFWTRRFLYGGKVR